MTSSASQTLAVARACAAHLATPGDKGHAFLPPHDAGPHLMTQAGPLPSLAYELCTCEPVAWHGPVRPQWVALRAVLARGHR